MMPTEKQILAEVLELYKQHPCLWDSRLDSYTNKCIRQKAYNVIFQKYKEVFPDCRCADMKKKIDNMRTSFRREHKKVLVSRLSGAAEEYVPQLWYYENMLFLNEVCDYKVEVKDTTSNDDEPREEILYSHDDSDEEEEKPQMKRQKLSSVYLHDDTDYIDDFQSHHQSQQVMNNSSTNGTTEAESFGITVGMQLKELDVTQRIFAEKLISDVIYHARLNQLSANSNFNLN